MSIPAIIKIKIRTGTLAEWTSANPILLEGEFGLITDEIQVIIGNGASPFLNLIDSFHTKNQIASKQYIDTIGGALQLAIGNETTNRTNADNTLQNNIDNVVFDITSINGTLLSNDIRISSLETLIANFDLTLDAKGQLLILNIDTGKYSPLQVGTNGKVLTADDTNAFGISWSDIPAQSKALEDLTDVNINPTTLLNGDALQYDAVNGEWINSPIPFIPTTLDELNDVDASNPSVNDVLKYNGADWINSPLPFIPSALDDLSDVVIPTPSVNDLLTYNGTSWVNLQPATYGDMYKSTYDTDNDGVVDSSEKMITIGRNSTGATLYQGTIVYISGSTGNRPNFVKAQANAESTSAGTFGVVVNDIANNSDGYVCTIGTLHNLDTRTSATNPFTDVTLADGDTIYLHPTIAGYVTNVKPSAPNHLVYVGKVVRTTASNGTIVYRIQNGYELNELHNVQANSPANKDVLYYDTSDSQWKTNQISNVLGFTPANSSSSVTSVGASLPLTSSGGLNPSISIAKATTLVDGYLSATDFNTFNNKVNTSRSINVTSPLLNGGDLSADRNISIQKATTLVDGYLASADFNTFNNKQVSYGIYRKAGRWYNNGFFAPANANFTNQLAIRYVPLLVDADITITRLGINVTGVAPATSTCRLGIYSNDATTTQPLNRLVDSGTIAIDTTGAKSVTGLSVALTKGLYWLAYVSNASSGTITGLGTNFMFDVKGQANIGGVGFAGFNQTFTYGALPSTAGTLSEVNSTGTICIFYFQ